MQVTAWRTYVWWDYVIFLPFSSRVGRIEGLPQIVQELPWIAWGDSSGVGWGQSLELVSLIMPVLVLRFSMGELPSLIVLNNLTRLTRVWLRPFLHLDNLCIWTISSTGGICVVRVVPTAESRTKKLRILMKASSNHHRLTHTYFNQPSFHSFFNT